MASLWAELNRRSVIKVAVGYAASSWLVLQVAALLSNVFAVPDWVMRGIVIVLAVGFPVALVLAWIYEITTSGVKRTEDVSPAEHLSAREGQKLNFVVIGILSVAVILFAADKFMLDERRDSAADFVSIAVLPFDFDSQSVAAHFQQIPLELARLLSRNGKLHVVTADAIAALPINGSLQAFATRLGARFLVTGQLMEIDRDLELNLELFDKGANELVWQKHYRNAHLQQTGIAAAADLANAIGAGSNRYDSEDIDSAAYDDYLRAEQMLRADPASNEAETLLLGAVRASTRFAAAYGALCSLYLTRYSLFDDPALFAMAEQSCIRAWTIDSESIEVLTSLAKLSLMSGQISKARDYAESALAISPGYYAAEVELANTYVDDDPDVAELMYERIVSRNPGSPGALKRLQNLYFHQGRAEEAVEIQRAVVRLVPNDLNAKFNLTSNLMLAGEFAEAKTLIEGTLADLDAGSAMIPDFEGNLATIKFFLGDYEGAASLYSAAIDKQSVADPLMYRNLGDAVWHLSGPEVAREYFQRAIEATEAHAGINPDSEEYLAELIVSYGSLRARDEFEALRDRAVAGVKAEDPQVLYSIAVGASRLGDLQVTRTFAERALEAGFPAVWLNADPDIALAGQKF